MAPKTNPIISDSDQAAARNQFRDIYLNTLYSAIHRTQSPILWATWDTPPALRLPPTPTTPLTVTLHLHPSTAPDSLYALITRIQRTVALRHLSHPDHITHPPHLALPPPQIALTSTPYEQERPFSSVLSDLLGIQVEPLWTTPPPQRAYPPPVPNTHSAANPPPTGHQPWPPGAAFGRPGLRLHRAGHRGVLPRLRRRQGQGTPKRSEQAAPGPGRFGHQATGPRARTSRPHQTGTSRPS